MHLALNRPALVRGLAVLDIAPRCCAPRHADILEALASAPLGEPARRKDVARWL